MFCPDCGKEIRDDAVFCSYCGSQIEWLQTGDHVDVKDLIHNASKKVSQNLKVAAVQTSEAIKSTTKSASNEMYTPPSQGGTHPYHQLGGWLAFLTYGLLVGMVLMTISQVIALFGVFRYIRYYSGYVVFLMVLEVMVYILIMYFCFKMFLMVKKKNPLFLRFYEMMTIVEAALYVVLFLLPYSSRSDAISGLIQTMIVFFIWTTYFRKSVRVRTYFGTDAYLRKSIFFKNAQAPKPAE